jgi:uncharacterized protein (DUF362 family)
MKHTTIEPRRDFLKTVLAGGAAALAASRWGRAAMAADAPQAAQAAAAAAPAKASTAPTKIAVTHGDERGDNVLRGLKTFEKQIAEAIGKRRVVVKPNNVVPSMESSCSHVDTLDAIFDFLKGIGKIENAVLAESPSAGSALDGFDELGYGKLATKYKIKFVDLDEDKPHTVMAFNEGDVRPRPVHVASMLADQTNNYIISACMLKTHDRVVATLSLKNIVFGSGMKQADSFSGGGGAWGGGDENGKQLLHGGGFRGININLAMLAPLLHPSLSVIDGFSGMQGNGPAWGEQVDHRVCVVGADWLAADRVGIALMGIDLSDVGYLTYLAKSGIGETDLAKIEIVGEPIKKLAKKYELSHNVQEQLEWKTAAKIAPSA